MGHAPPRHSGFVAIVTFLLLTMAAAVRVPVAAAAGEVMRYVYAPPESSLDRRHLYRLAILRAALERTRASHGPYALEPSPAGPMSQERQMEELRDGGTPGALTVMYRSASPELERDLLPVCVPVDRGLTGYRVLLIRGPDQDRFAGVRTLDDLRHFTYGAEHWWLDIDVLRANGFRTVVGTNYEGLFRMLANRRFDAFPRGVVEVIDEFDLHRARVPGLAIERELVLHYPLPMYFWFAKTDEGRRLAARAQAGMAAMIADGSFDRMFFEHFGRSIHALDLTRRRIYRIANPFVNPAAPPFDDRQLWFDPTTDPVPPPTVTGPTSLLQPLRPAATVRRRVAPSRFGHGREVEGADGL